MRFFTNWADNTTLMVESEKELKSLLMRVREESQRAGLKLNTQNTKVMPSSPITAWPIEGEKVEVVTDFLFLGSKITADSDCSHEFRRQLLLGRKAMTNLDSVLKSRDVTLPTEVHIVKAMGFPSHHVWLWDRNAKELMPSNYGAGEDSWKSLGSQGVQTVNIFFFFLLYNTVLVLPYINMNPPRVYTCFPSWAPSHLPPHTIPLGHPSAPAPSILYHASNLDWRFISYMILYYYNEF